MRIGSFAWVIAVASALAGSAPGVGQDGDPVDEKNWLNEKTWPAFVAPRRLKIADTDDAEAKLLKERFNAAQQEFGGQYITWLQNAGSLPQVFEAARRAADARREAGGPGSDRVTILKEKAEFARVVEQQAVAHRRKFKSSPGANARYFRADAELELLRAQKDARGEAGK